MARMDDSKRVPILTNPVWAAEALAHTRLIPGGARLDRSSFGVGVKSVEAGTLVYRTLANRDAVVSPIASINAAAFVAPQLNASGSVVSQPPLAAPATITGTPTTPLSPVVPAVFAGSGEANKGFKLFSNAPGGTANFPGTSIPPVPTLTAADEVYIVAFDVIDLQNNPDVELVRPTTLVYENWFWWNMPLPSAPANIPSSWNNAATCPFMVPITSDAAGLTILTNLVAALRTVLRTRYQCIIGGETELS